MAAAPSGAVVARNASPGRSESVPFGSSSFSSGPVMNVVTSAMITSIVNSACEMTCRSSAMLSTISSVSPRVFMSEPNAAASRSRNPPSLPRIVTSTPLPSTATPISSSVSSQSSGRSSAPIFVRRPVITKKRGSRTVTTKSSSRRATSCDRSARRGMIRPITKAPKIALMPISTAR